MPPLPAGRVLAMTVVLALAVVGLSLPVAGQSQAPPQVNIFELQPRCAAPNSRVTVYVAGSTNRFSVSLAIFSPTGQQVGQGSTGTSTGGWATEMGFGTLGNGAYEVRATVETAVASGYIHVPCQNPALEFDPPCSGSTTSQVRVTGRWFQPFSNGYVDMNNDGSEELARLPVDNRGTFSGVVNVAPSTAARQVRGRDLDQNSAVATWSPCPPGTVPSTTTSTSTTTTSTTPDVDDTTTTTRPGDDPAPDDPTPDDPPPTTQPVPDAPGVPVTIPPTIDLPPPTPGATLTVAPELGPAGFVTGAVGTGFPPGPVSISWTPGIGTTTAIVGPDGTFTARMLVLPNDRLGPRALVATAGTTNAFDAFLVVQSSVQPSGQNVQQINRIRSFNQR